MRLPILNRHSRDEMSAYLDGEFIPLRLEAMQAHLASCESCRTELAALHRLNVDLGALLEVPTPRPAALMPLMAVGPLRERLPATVPARIAALANGMRLAGTAMTLALAVVLVLDLTGSGTTSNSESALPAGRVQDLATGQYKDKSTDTNFAPANLPKADTGDLTLPPTPTSDPVATLPSGGEGASAPDGSSSATGTSSHNPASPASSPALIESPGAVIAGEDTPGPAFSTYTGLLR